VNLTLNPKSRYGLCNSPGLHGKSGFKEQHTKANKPTKKGIKAESKKDAEKDSKKAKIPKKSAAETKGDSKKSADKGEPLKRSESGGSDNTQKAELQRPATKATQKDFEMAFAAREAGDMKPRLGVVTVGHVDAGKSTLMGHLLFEIGEVSQKVMHKYDKLSREAGKASFSYAWVMDEQEEERSRGVTIDVGIKSAIIQQT